MLDRQGTNPFTNHRDSYVGAPEGIPVSPALEYAQPLQPASLWLGKAVFGRVGAIDLFAFAGLLVSALAFFFVGRALMLSPPAAAVVGFVVAFGPWSCEQLLAGHIAFLHTWPIALLLGALVWVGVRRSVRGAVAAGVAGAACFAAAAYLGLIVAPLVVAALVVTLLTTRGWADRFWLATLTCAGGATTALLLVPALLGYLSDRATASRIAGHGAAEAATYSASLASYVEPGPRLWLLGNVRHLHASADFGAAEQVVFFGYTVLALAIVGIWLVLRRPALLGGSRPLLFAARTAAIALPLSIVLSLPPRVAVGGASVPLPSALIGHITTFYRVYARFGLTAALAAAILAAVVIDAARRRRPALGLALVGLVLVELWPGLLPAWQTTSRPVDRWLARRPPGIVAHYPQPTDQPAANDLALREEAYQPDNAQALYTLLSGGTGETREQGIRILSRYLNDPATPGILAAEHVRYVVVHDDVYRAEGTAAPPIPAGLEEIGRFPGERVFRLSPSVAPANLDQVLEQRATEVAVVQGLQAPEVTGTTGISKTSSAAGTWGVLQGDGRIELSTTDARVRRAIVVLKVATDASNAQLGVASGGISGSYAVGPRSAGTTIVFGPVPIVDGHALLELSPTTRRPIELTAPPAAQALADYSVSLRANG